MSILTGLAIQPVFNAAMTTQVVFRDALEGLSRAERAVLEGRTYRQGEAEEKMSKGLK